MKRARVALFVLVALALATALPAAAGYFTIKLKNGNELDSLYRPRLASEGGDKVLVTTETGNWISLPVDAFDVNGFLLDVHRGRPPRRKDLDILEGGEKLAIAIHAVRSSSQGAELGV